MAFLKQYRMTFLKHWNLSKNRWTDDFDPLAVLKSMVFKVKLKIIIMWSRKCHSHKNARRSYETNFWALNFVSSFFWEFLSGWFNYECKLFYKWVQIWVQTWSQIGPNMSANSNTRGSKYECKHRNVPFDEIRPEMRVRNSQHDWKLFDACTHIWTLLC